jgi:hypothetical protein
MLWRILAHFLTIALLALPGACPCHAHQGQAAAQTHCASQPHFHLHAGHSHSGHGDGKPIHRHESATDEDATPFACGHSTSHDEDAVYLPDSLNSRVTRKVSTESKSVDSPAVMTLTSIHDGAFGGVPGLTLRDRAGVHYGPPVYLLTRALRI